MNLFPYILAAQGYDIQKASHLLRNIQSKNADEFCDWQLKKAWEIVRFHFDNNTFYRSKVGRHLPTRWEDLPIVTKNDLQRPSSEILTAGIAKKDCYFGSTSGSSGIPFFFAKDKFAHAMTWALIANRYSWHGLYMSDKQGRFYGIPKEFRAYWKEKIKDKMMNRLRFNVFDLTDHAFSNTVEHFRSTKLDYLYGYTSPLVLFARYLLQNNIVLKEVCPSLRVCISTSEMCVQEDHEILEHAFGVKHIREYGVSETCVTAVDALNGRWCLTEETLFSEIVDNSFSQVPNGVEGDIVSTSLFNRAFPMIRYQVGDVGILEDRQDTIYRGLRKLVGRTNDNVVLPSGKTAAGLTFYYISRSILESSGALKEFIVRQTALDHFVLDIIADRSLTSFEIMQINEKVGLYLEPGLSVSLNYVERIDRPASGKLKHFYSELS